jgi:hypothetical protein
MQLVYRYMKDVIFAEHVIVEAASISVDVFETEVGLRTS